MNCQDVRTLKVSWGFYVTDYEKPSFPNHKVTRLEVLHWKRSHSKWTCILWYGIITRFQNATVAHGIKEIYLIRDAGEQSARDHGGVWGIYRRLPKGMTRS